MAYESYDRLFSPNLLYLSKKVFDSLYNRVSKNAVTTYSKNILYLQSGMKESSEFAEELFDALARKRCITSPAVTKDELREFWEQITDTGFDARLQTFFDM